jgi:hypothetical protein
MDTALHNNPHLFISFIDLEIEVCVLRQQQLQDLGEAADGGFVGGTLAIVIGGVDGRPFLNQIFRNFRLPVQINQIKIKETILSINRKFKCAVIKTKKKNNNIDQI